MLIEITPMDVGNSGLNNSAEASKLTPLPHQSGLLPMSKSCLFSGETSGLDAFSLYNLVRSCPALPCQTTGRPVAPTARSSRTGATFPSSNQHF
jgi:hypothetical protein